MLTTTWPARGISSYILKQFFSCRLVCCSWVRAALQRLAYFIAQVNSIRISTARPGACKSSDVESYEWRTAKSNVLHKTHRLFWKEKVFLAQMTLDLQKSEIALLPKCHMKTSMCVWHSSSQSLDPQDYLITWSPLKHLIFFLTLLLQAETETPAHWIHFYNILHISEIVPVVSFRNFWFTISSLVLFISYDGDKISPNSSYKSFHNFVAIVN